MLGAQCTEHPAAVTFVQPAILQHLERLGEFLASRFERHDEGAGFDGSEAATSATAPARLLLAAVDWLIDSPRPVWPPGPCASTRAPNAASVKAATAIACIRKLLNLIDMIARCVKVCTPVTEGVRHAVTTMARRLLTSCV